MNHDFLWRTMRSLPERGTIGIFNRSYYEEVLIVRVHPEILALERLPEHLVSGKIWQERFEDINAFENYLSRNGIVVVKFFLNVSKKGTKVPVSWTAWTSRKRTGNFRRPMPWNGNIGILTRTPTKT